MSQSTLLFFLYQFARPQWKLALVALVLATLVSLLEVATTSLVLPLTQLLSGETTIAIPQDPRVLPDFLSFYGSLDQRSQMLGVILALLTLTVIKNGSLYLSSLSINAFMLKSGTMLRQKCVERFLELEIPFYTQANVGELLSYVNEQSQRSEQLFSSLLELIREILSTACLLVFLIFLSPALTVVTVVSLIAVFASLRMIFRGVQVYGRQSATAIERFSALIAEMVSGIRVIKSFNTEPSELNKAEQALHERYRTEFTAYRFNSAVAPITETAGITVLLMIILIGTYLLSGVTSLALPLLLTYTLTLLRTLPRINHLNGLRSHLFLLSGSLEAIQSFFSTTTGTTLPNGTQSYQPLRSGLVFENVTFTYPNNSEPTLRNINLDIAKGKTTAVIGHSGSGKSTLVDLVMRFYDAQQGCIRVDSVDLKKLKVGSWRGATAIVSQDTFLFNTTVRENIAYGCSNATDSEVFEAAKQAYAYDFIQELPHGFETVVGNRGTMLSGGQRQRIAIARAILRDPDILILDEATSALDSTSERIVQRAIEEVSRDRTVIVIAHRLSTIERADNIVVMNQGEIIEQGTHQQLLSLQSQYWSLYCSPRSANSIEVELTV